MQTNPVVEQINIFKKR